MFISNAERCEDSKIKQERARIENKYDDPLTYLG